MLESVLVNERGRRPDVALSIDGAEAAAEFEKSCREMYDQMARIAIVPSWVRFYDFGAGRVPKFLKQLAERNRS